MEKYKIYYENQTIPYYLERKSVKNINLRINKEGIIFVSANNKIPFNMIDNFVNSKKQWILKQLAKLEQVRENAPDSLFYTGKTLYFLGQPFLLKIKKTNENRIILSPMQKEIYFSTTNTEDQNKMHKQYIDWLRIQANSIYEKAVDSILPYVKQEGISKPQIQIRNMKTLWGSCSIYNGTVRLNLQLIKCPFPCIQQVVLHELLHFKHPNHSQFFYADLKKYMPDFKEREKELLNYKDGV